MSQPLIPPFGAPVHLRDYDPDYLDGSSKKDAKKDLKKKLAAAMEADQQRLDVLQEALYAEGKHALLIVLQGMDTSGKDGSIRHVFSSVDPQGVQVTSFKVPTADELARDFLWRIHRAVPPKGMIGIFNRSQYEDVLVVRVHNLVPESIWRERYDHINRFEEMLHEHGTTILKFFLHISKAEQKKRLTERRDTPEKQWKFSLGDLKERAYWDAYQAAYEAVLTHCNTPYAPWHIVPANSKWYRNYVIARTVRETLERLNPQFPTPEKGIESVEIPD
jgi:PPK2 family polyphosphate:nucleotide phosphotransferase